MQSNQDYGFNKKTTFTELDFYKKHDEEPELTIGGLENTKVAPQSILSKLNYYNLHNEFAEEKYKKNCSPIGSPKSHAKARSINIHKKNQASYFKSQVIQKGVNVESRLPCSIHFL